LPLVEKEALTHVKSEINPLWQVLVNPSPQAMIAGLKGVQFGEDVELRQVPPTHLMCTSFQSVSS
jgi:hypothetical protein